MSTMFLPQLNLVMPPMGPHSSDDAVSSITTKIEPTDDGAPNAALPFPAASPAASSSSSPSGALLSASNAAAASMMPNAVPGGGIPGINGVTDAMHALSTGSGTVSEASSILNGVLHVASSPMPVDPTTTSSSSVGTAADAASASASSSSAAPSPAASPSNGPGRPRKYTKRGANQPPKLFSCDICGKEFRRKFNMRVHKRTHLHHSARPWACQHCNETFAQKSNFKRHVLTRHEKPIKCPSCKERFATEEEVTAHLASVHPGDHKRARIRKIASRPKFRYRCPCKKRFDLLKDLVQHQGECPQQKEAAAASGGSAATSTASSSAADVGAMTPSPAMVAAIAAASAAAGHTPTTTSAAASALSSPAFSFSNASFPTSLQDPTLDPASRVGTTAPPPLENPDMPNAVPNGGASGSSMSPTTIKSEHSDVQPAASIQASSAVKTEPHMLTSTNAAFSAASLMPPAAAMPALTITVQAQPGGMPTAANGLQLPGGSHATLNVPNGGGNGSTYPSLSVNMPNGGGSLSSLAMSQLGAQLNPALLGTNLMHALSAYPALGGALFSNLGLSMNGGGLGEQKVAQELLQGLQQNAAALIHAHQRASNGQGVGGMQQHPTTQPFTQ